jgi:hypothetical protein
MLLPLAAYFYFGELSFAASYWCDVLLGFTF